MILITGADRIGKTTFAKELGKFMNLPVYGFADEVRKSFESQIYFQSFHHLKIDYLKHTDEWMRLFKEHGSGLWDFLNKNDELKGKLREDIIAFAENTKDKYGKDYWAYKLFREHKDAPSSIIHDFRFDEELFFILAQSNKRVSGHKLFHPQFNCYIPIVIQLITAKRRDKSNTLSPLVTNIIDNCGLSFFIPDVTEYEDKEEWKSLVKKSTVEISKYLQTLT